MNAVEMILGRRSVRKYKDKKVERSIVEDIINTVKYSPSWTNSQICRYNIVDSPEIISTISNTAMHNFNFNIKTIKNAAGILIISYIKNISGKVEKYGIDYSKEEEKYWESFDVGIACQTFCLAAYEKGIGTCIMGVIDKNKLKEILSIPKDEEVGVLITYGYPEKIPAPPKRKELNEILRFMD